MAAFWKKLKLNKFNSNQTACYIAAYLTTKTKIRIPMYTFTRALNKNILTLFYNFCSEKDCLAVQDII